MRRLAAVGTAVFVVAALAAAVGGGAGAADDRKSALVELGRRLFFDPAASRNGRIACAACHDPEHGFSDPRPFSTDEDRDLPRRSQPLEDLGGTGFHWDGEFDTVREVIDARILPLATANLATVDRAIRRATAAKAAGGSVDALTSAAALMRFQCGAFFYVAPPSKRTDPAAAVSSLVQRVMEASRYDRGFAAAFGDRAVTRARVGDALEAYVVSIRTGDSPFDRFVAGDSRAIGESAKRGFDLFRGRAGCTECHVAAGPHAPFTDGRFHDTGVEARHRGDGVEPASENDLGRGGTTFVRAEIDAFKTPSLRDVARRAPYFHDASAATLADAVRFYVRPKSARLDPKLRAFEATDADVADVVAFLESLTSDRRPGLGGFTPIRARRLVIRVETIDGVPVANADVAVTPFGDRLANAAALPERVALKTDAKGEASLAMPASTHVVVEAAGVPATAPLPDWTASVRLVVTPKDRMSLVATFDDGVRERPGHIVVHTSASPAAPGVSFTYLRNLDGSDALYAAPASPTDEGVKTALVAWHDPATKRDVDVFVDLRPGASGRLDLRSAAHEPRDAEADSAAAAAISERIRRLEELTASPPPR